MRELLIAFLALCVGLLIGWFARRTRTSRHEIQPKQTVSDDIDPRTVKVLDMLRTVSLVVDPSDRVIRSSPGAAALNIVRGQEMVHNQLRTVVRKARRDNAVHEVELELHRGLPGGGRMLLNVRVAPLTDEAVLVLVDDQSQSRRVEETRRDFVVNVSHELKTPVAGLSLLAEAVDDAREDSQAVHRFATRMRRETDRLNRLVQEIVQLSRLQVGETLDDPQRIDVRACAFDAIEHLRLLWEDRKITIVTADDGTPAEVFGDGNLITTAIRNLVENAVNYSAAGTRVAVTVMVQDDLVSVSVTDEGTGIPEDELERIFERFYRVDTARSRRTGGTGLGLAIVKHVCANHGGEVTVWSEEGHGSTFTMRLPAAADDPNPDDRTVIDQPQPARKATP